jgi:ribosomal protein S18 acetylase RimI-like enzyme
MLLGGIVLSPSGAEQKDSKVTSTPGLLIPSHLANYHWRPIQFGDNSAIKDMLTTAAETNPMEERPSDERIKHIYDLLGENIETNSLAAFSTGSTVVALALVFILPADDDHVAMIDGSVHVDYRGLGLGSFILEWMEKRVHHSFEGIDDGKSQLIRMSCADHQSDRIALFKQHQFSPVRYSYKMQRDLRQPVPEKRLTPELRFEPWCEALNGPMMHAFNEAFQGHWGLPTINETLWQQLFTGVPQFRSDLTYLVMNGDEIVGFCLNWIDEGKNEQTGVKEGWVEALGVLPAWRGRGIASALLSRTLQAFSDIGLERAALDVDAQNPTGALRLYEKVGFEAVKRTIIFHKQLNQISGSE